MIKNVSSFKELLKFLTKWLHKKKVITKVILFVIIIAILIPAIETTMILKTQCVTTTNQEKGVTETAFLSLETTDAIEETIDNTVVSSQEESMIDSTVNNTTESSVVTHKYFDVPLSKELQDYIFVKANEFSMPVELVFALIDVESNFNANVISKTNDYGLCQINIINHEWLKNELGLDNMLDPYQNVTAGIYMFSKHLKNMNGDVNLAAMCYNCGSSGAKKLWNQGIYSTSYSRKLNDTYESYKNM